MFFYLSKIFWFFVQPLNLAIFLLLAALLAALFGCAARRYVIGCRPRFSSSRCRPGPRSAH